MNKSIFYLHNLTALHAGTGQGVGVVDLPIARAKATNLPIVAGSSIKGVLRDEIFDIFVKKSPYKEMTDEERKQIIDKNIINPLFGKNENADHAGAIAFGDANLLILPIRSFAGVVAYATCPFILRQYQRDVGKDKKIPQLNDNALISNDSILLINDTQIALEDLDIVANKEELASDWATDIAHAIYPNSPEWQDEFKKRFVILPDGIFSFLADTATEIRTRIKIDRHTRVVQDGALWTEENLPADSVLWGVLGVSQSRDNNNKKSADELAGLLPKDEINLQIGGKHTVGRGFCRLLIADTKEQK
ncbi:type III-B CRISPR module RAMP protein Cmr4 [Alysiella filiformis]|uniref:CRISPR-associated protein Cmr4 n=1 Tax=Alysiella filiformis DSM 16848 TaxID=1120981 RepID=A0A286EWY3_9NEIS|nr:type III-B CRISPR module RAMP protein Cmr4 [Alysiella filiformis]QMT32131.1 type III-B CRISPR module RAMP protein Cmr4 [Alysiella filiformis]UBQ56953.1 type III-B CRISPR module RAMP protein Cmr4 [Alysiella filiformis DSM 16848]SOD75224.1 CRISPR-associated protein Cmr4 [Alysiella filiformis DSM 16848]